MLTASYCAEELFADPPEPAVRIGLVTDLHYAAKPPAGTRHYRETPAKLAEAAKQFRRDRPDFLVELGDLIDAAESVELEQQYLATINEQFSGLCERRHYVLGNHCVDTLTKDEFLQAVGQPKSYDSFDFGGIHFVVLDSCFRSDGEPYGRKNFKWTDANLPAAELEWLDADLKANDKPTVVFAHQRLDEAGRHSVNNRAEVRAILESGGHVLAVFQGHSHHNDLNQINNIHYCTLAAMVEGSGAESNGYSVLEIDSRGTIRLTGFRRQESYRWPAVG
ncbi:alkaline phosphatase [Roseiconus nitratireducens]|uniref:Alkaline phosphatase n=2 Tax=Roseiconus nitratireducens TaxID=2605748 RepID=A0A5M6DHD6_9BACT|nr:metallophosphoesterase [Roseiconus nitratireducens]KAA5545599.1 alkaline phosphatase [Roseiconus nitratireducens]